MRIIDYMNTHFIPGWRDALRLRIIQLHTFITLFVGIIYNMAREYPTMAQDVIAKMPPALLHPVTINLILVVWLVIGAYARLVCQPNLQSPNQ